MSDTIIPATSFYYSGEFSNEALPFSNSVYCLDIAMENKLANWVFHNDLNRIIYASNDFCFRRRLEMQGQEEEGAEFLNFPFINYYLVNTSFETERMLKKNSAQVQGMLNLGGYAEETGVDFRVIPLRLEYESTIWFSQDKDLQYAQTKLFDKSSNEIILYGDLVAPNKKAFKLPAFVKFDFQFKPEYKENEWMETNNIVSMSMDFSMDTMLIFGYKNNDLAQDIIQTVSLTEEVIMNFISTKSDILSGSPTPIVPQDIITSYFT
jgi:hypothetical protein